MKIIFKDDNGTIIREEILSFADVVSMETDVISIVDWISNAFREKIRRQKDLIVEHSGRGSRMTDIPTKDEIILDLKTNNSPLVKNAKDKQKEQEERE